HRLDGDLLLHRRPALLFPSGAHHQFQDSRPPPDDLLDLQGEGADVGPLAAPAPGSAYGVQPAVDDGTLAKTLGTFPGTTAQAGREIVVRAQPHDAGCGGIDVTGFDKVPADAVFDDVPGAVPDGVGH